MSMTKRGTVRSGQASVATVSITAFRFALYRNASHLENAKHDYDDDGQNQRREQRIQKQKHENDPKFTHIKHSTCSRMGHVPETIPNHIPNVNGTRDGLRGETPMVTESS